MEIDLIEKNGIKYNSEKYIIEDKLICDGDILRDKTLIDFNIQNCFSDKEQEN